MNVPIPPAALDQMLSAPPPLLGNLLIRGVRILVDKDGHGARLAATRVEVPAPVPPTEAEYLQVVHDFLYHALWTAKKWKRGELWSAKVCMDGHMKWRLLRLMEWQAPQKTEPDRRYRWAPPSYSPGRKPCFTRISRPPRWT